MIDAAFRLQAEAALAAVERDDGVRILLAVESGSRAWGFASSDSDYDVRFIFVRPLADYLRVALPRNVIERPIDGDLDLGGWDLRKALELMVRSNPVALEWLASPIVYRTDPPVVAALRDHAGQAAHAPALAYHYDRLARGAWQAGTSDIRLKSYFYALRPAFALLWLRQRNTTPPMDLSKLRAGVETTSAVADAIEALLRSKEAAAEAVTVARQPALESFLAQVLADPEPRPAAWDMEPARAAADALFSSLAVGP